MIFPYAVRLTDRLRFHHCTDDQAIHTRMLRNDESQRRAVCLTKTVAGFKKKMSRSEEKKVEISEVGDFFHGKNIYTHHTHI